MLPDWISCGRPRCCSSASGEVVCVLVYLLCFAADIDDKNSQKMHWNVIVLLIYYVKHLMIVYLGFI